ncbi:peptidase S24/S26A/S26B/S26C, partial [Lentinula lateritia]
IINLACATHLFLEYVGTVSLMSGPSMLPTLAASGEVVIEDRFSLRLNPASLARGDLVVVRSPIDPTAIVCKRIIGLPGDVVCVDPTGSKAPSTEHLLVPKGHIWICGDNMTHSRDSRDYGPVPIALIRSKLFARVNL